MSSHIAAMRLSFMASTRLTYAPAIYLSLALSLSGCFLQDTDRPSLRLETARDAYVFEATEIIEVTAENTSSSAIYFSTCMPTMLEELDAGRVVATIAQPVCECICRQELESGASWNYPVSLEWFVSQKKKLQLRESHSYRFRLAFFEDKNMTHPLDARLLHTNKFELTR